MRIRLLVVGCSLTALVAACGESDLGSPAEAGGSANAATGGATGGVTTTGGVNATGGVTTTGGVNATGGENATGGAHPGGANMGGASAGGSAGKAAGPAFDCRGPEILACEVDDDCTFIRTNSCCGPGPILGVGTKFRDEQPDCYKDIYPLQECPPLGCSSTATTEDSLIASGERDSGVIARCYEIEPGRKECRTTLAGSCVHQTTRCAEGDECQNDCDQPCTCRDGFLVCEKPEPGSPCELTRGCSYRNSPTDGTALNCVCSSDGTWTC